MHRFSLLIALGMVAACNSEIIESEEAVVLAFDMDWANLEPFDIAWRAARDDPTKGVGFIFPIVSNGIEPGAEARLYVGRSTTDGTPLKAGNDVILMEQHQVATAIIDGQGNTEFGPLEVTEGNWSSGTNTIHYSYLCGATTIVARSFRNAEGDVSGSQFLAAAWFNAVSEDCE